MHRQQKKEGPYSDFGGASSEVDAWGVSFTVGGAGGVTGGALDPVLLPSEFSELLTEAIAAATRTATVIPMAAGVPMPDGVPDTAAGFATGAGDLGLMTVTAGGAGTAGEMGADTDLATGGLISALLWQVQFHKT